MRRYSCIIILFLSGIFSYGFLFAQQDSQVNLSKQPKAFIQEWEGQLLKMERNLRDSKNSDDQHVLARIYFYLNYYDKTQGLLEYLSKNDSLSKEEIKMLALLYYQKGKFSESIDLFKTVYSADKNDDQAKYYLIKISHDLDIFLEDSCRLNNDNSSFSNQYVTNKENHSGDTENKMLYAERKNIEKYIFSMTHGVNTIKKIKISEIKDLPNEVKELITADSIPLFKDAPAGIIDLQTNFTVINDNSSVYTEQKIIKILNESGKETYSDIQIEYDGSFQSIEIDKIRVYSNDGVVFEISNDNIRTLTPWTGTYSNYKITSINLPNITLNSVIEYKYKLITHHNLHPNDFQFSLDIQNDIPILKQKQEVRYPKNKTLTLKYPKEYKPDYKEDTSNIYYCWNIDNSKALVMEKNSRIDEYLPVIKGAFFTSWKEVYDWLKPYFLGKNIELSNELKNFLTDLTKDTKDDEEKVRLVFNWINDNIRYVAIEIGKGGIFPRNVNDIFTNRYGDCKDQATLLVAFLRGLGIKAYPVLINTGSKVDMDSTLYNIEFTHCISYIELENKKFFCDVIAKQTPYNYLHPVDQNRYCYVLKDDNYKIMKTPVSNPLENLELKEMKIQMLQNGDVIVKKFNQSFGEDNTINKNYFIGLNKDETKEAIQYDISYFCPGGKLEDYNIQNLNINDKSIIINETFTIPNWVMSISKKMYSFKLPTIYFSFDELDQTERKHDLHYRTTMCKKYNVEVEFPDNFIIDKLPENLNINSDAVDYSYTYSKDKDKLTLVIQYSRKATEIKVNKYPEFKKLHDNILNKLQESIILKKID